MRREVAGRRAGGATDQTSLIAPRSAPCNKGAGPPAAGGWRLAGGWPAAGPPDPRTCSLTRPSPPRYPASARALPAAGWPCHPPRLCEETEGRARRLVACRRSQCNVDHSGAPFLAPPSPFVSALRRRLALALSHAGVRARDASRRGERAAARGVRRKNASASRFSPPFLPLGSSLAPCLLLQKHLSG